jgi:cytochrome c-type biogenesis protein CcmH/NrfG
VTVHQATTMQAPQQNVATAEASVPVEHKPDPAPAADVDKLRDKVQLRPKDANQWNRVR